MEYRIEGGNLQYLEITLKEGEEIYAESGAMVCKTANIAMETRMPGKGIGGKLMGLFKRKITGESAFMVYYRCEEGVGKVTLTGPFPGKIAAVEVTPDRSFIVQKDGFLCATTGVEIDLSFSGSLKGGLFGGEGFILQKLKGNGVAFVHACGDMIEYNLKEGEKLQVDTGCVVGFEETVGYSAELVKGFKNIIFGGEGLFLATLRGPGRVIVQTMNIETLRSVLAPPVDRGSD